MSRVSPVEVPANVTNLASRGARRDPGTGRDSRSNALTAFEHILAGHERPVQLDLRDRQHQMKHVQLPLAAFMFSGLRQGTRSRAGARGSCWATGGGPKGAHAVPGISEAIPSLFCGETDPTASRIDGARTPPPHPRGEKTRACAIAAMVASELGLSGLDQLPATTTSRGTTIPPPTRDPASSLDFSTRDLNQS